MAFPLTTILSSNPDNLSFEQRQILQRAQDLQRIGVNEYTGPLSYGARASGGGENAIWGMVNGQEVPVFKSMDNMVGGGGAFFSLPDLLQKYGSFSGIQNAMNTVGAGGGDEVGGRLFDVAGWGTSPSNDTFSGKDGLRDLATIAAMAAPVVGAAAAAPAAATAGAGGAGGGLSALGLSPEMLAATNSGLASGESLLGGSALLGGVGDMPISGGEIVDSASWGADSAFDGSLGGGLNVDEFGNVTNLGGGTSNIGGGMSVDAFGNVTSAGTTGAASSGGLAGLLGGSGFSPEMLRILGTVGATGLGMYGSNKQADSLRDIAAQGRADRAPFYNKSVEYLNNPNAFIEGPGKTAVDAVLRRLSVNGNPANRPTSLATAGEFALNSWLNATTGLGNLGLAGEDTRANLQAQAAGADANVLNSLGYGLGQLTNPPRSLADILKQTKGALV